MKTTKYLIAAAFAATSLFAACKKDNNSTGGAAYDTKLMAPTANINYRVQTIPQRPGYMLQWTSGSMITSEVIFTGTFINGDPVEQRSYEGKGFNTIDLVTPSITNLGVVNVPYNNYLRAIFTIELSPINSLTSLVLKGQYYQIQPPSGIAPFQPVPVELAISTPVALNAVMQSKLRINNGNYIATIAMDVNQLTNGIDDALLSTAARTNGMILISNQSNPNLYGIVVKNLEDYLMNMQLTVEATSSPVSAPL
jgi:hypothetical protein